MPETPSARNPPSNFSQTENYKLLLKTRSNKNGLLATTQATPLRELRPTQIFRSSTERGCLAQTLT
jgi:hypothetical protein